MLLLDTHAWAWAFSGDPLLSRQARQAMDEADGLILSAVTFYEITYKVNLGKWPQMQPFVARLTELAEGDVFIAPVTAELSVMAGQLDWPHRDPFDRHLAATALLFGLPLISADTVFDTLPGLSRIW